MAHDIDFDFLASTFLDSTSARPILGALQDLFGIRLSLTRQPGLFQNRL
jgi:hypothetical protein